MTAHPETVADLIWRRDPHQAQPAIPPAGLRNEPPATPAPAPSASKCVDCEAGRVCAAHGGRPEPVPPVAAAWPHDDPQPTRWIRPDRTVTPPRDEVPAPPIPTPPHCGGTHSPTRRCEWCDALADMATALRHVETVQRELDGRLHAQENRLAEVVGRLRRVEAALGRPGERRTR